MTISKSKLGLSSKDKAEVINIRLTKEKVSEYIDNTSFFPAYHMNKKYWITILLDSVACTDEILKLVDESYGLVG